MKKSKIAVMLALVAVILISASGIGKAWAYFTVSTKSTGAVVIHLDDETVIEETFSNWTKHVTIKNNSKSNIPVFIRANAYCAEYELTFTDESGKWSLGDDGYYYYADPVEPGEATEILDVHIDHVPTNEKAGATFDVVVVYESTMALYDEDGNPYADWEEIDDEGQFPEEQK